MKKVLIFDLDGTLWDATEAIASSWNSFFEANSLAARTTPEQIKYLAGRPYLDCLEAVTGRRDFPDSFLNQLNAEEKKRVCSDDGGRFLPGVREGLQSLKSEGFELAIVSNCEEWYLERFLAVSADLVDWVATDCFGRSKIPKSEMLRRMVNAYDGTCVAFVGDTTGDLAAAQACAVSFIGVAYGFGAEDLKKSGINLEADFAGVVKLARAWHSHGRS